MRGASDTAVIASAAKRLRSNGLGGDHWRSPRSRLGRQGMLERLSKGVYYRARQTSFGKSLPNPAAIQKLASRRKPVFPSGIAAANLLGFTTQTARRSEVATSALSLPRKLIGSDTITMPAGLRHGPVSPKPTRLCLISCVEVGKRVSFRHRKPSAEPSLYFQKRGVSSVCSKSLTPNHPACAPSWAPSENRSGRSAPR